MQMSVTQVARTYRSNALWHSNEEIWKRRGGKLPPLPSLTIDRAAAPALPIAGWSAFDQFALETTQGLAAVLNAAVRVKQAVRKLQSHSEASAVDRRGVINSDPSVLTAWALPGATPGTYRIEVGQCASAPIREGAELPSLAETVVAAGSNQMKLIVGDSSAPFSVYIVPSDTNKKALQKLQAAIHRTNLPVQASLISNEEEGTVKLRVIGTSTGSVHSFAIADVYGSAARMTGIEHDAYPGTDAVYRIDGGEPIVSGSNQVSLDGGKVSLSFHQSSSYPVEVQIIPDDVHAKQALLQVAVRYNELFAAFIEAYRYLNFNRVHNALGEAAALGLEQALHPQVDEASEEMPIPLPSTSWSSIGMIQYANGTVSVDEVALEQLLAARFEQWQSLLRDPEGPIGLLVGALNRLLALPTEDLLDKRKAAFQAFASYRFRPWGSLRTYLPLPLAGVLVNRFF